MYELDGNLKLIEVKDLLSDEDIQNGKWTNTAIDVKIRFTKNSLGVFQYKAFGFRSIDNKFTIAKIKNSEGVFEQKEARLKDLSAYIKEKTNAFFSLNNAFTTPEKTPKQAGLQLNDGETYADGKKLEIDENSGFFKISSEGIGLVTVLLEEGIVEEKTYLNTPPEGTVIKAPGVVTGSVEVVATKVTDLTTLATGVYDLATDKDARSDAYKGLVKIKESIGKDATTFIPILADVLLSAFSGNTAEDWKSLKDSKTDEGKKSHLFTRGAENTAISSVTGVTFVKELPEMAKKVSEKIDDVIKIGKKVFKSADEFANALYKARSDIRKAIINLPESKNLAIEYFEHIKKTDLSLKNVKFDDWFEKTFKTYEKGTPNFEAHHVIPADLLKSNEKFKQLLFDLRKADPDFKFDFNGLDNGIMLQKKSMNLDIINGHASHKKYNDAIDFKINEIIDNPRNVNKPERAFEEIQELIKNTKEKLKKEVLLGNKDVNDIVNF